MDKPINSTPRDARGVTEKTRREVFGAIGATALAGVAVASFAKPDAFASVRTDELQPDATLLAACAAFGDAHDEQTRTDDEIWNDDSLADAVSDRWYLALQGVLDAPEPTTPAGRAALARAAHIAISDECGTPKGGCVEDVATREQLLALRALASAAGGAS